MQTDFDMSHTRPARAIRAKRGSMKKPLFVWFSLALLAGCGGGGGGGGVPAGVPSTPAPSFGQLQVTPTVIALSAPGATQTVAATQANFNGTFTIGVDPASCNGVASVQPSGNNASFTVVAGQNAGHCRMTVVGGGNQVVTLDVTLTITQGGIH